MYVYARSPERVAKAWAIRLSQLRGLLRRLKDLSEMSLPARELLLKLVILSRYTQPEAEQKILLEKL